MLKRLLILGVVLLNSLHAKLLQTDVHAKSAILMNAATGTVLFEKNPHELSFPASCTKMATALYVIDVKRPEFSRIVEVSAESVRMKPAGRDWSKLPAYWQEIDGSKLGLGKGEKISIEELLYAIMLPSANDAANVLAESTSGSIPNFVNELNQYLKSLGCQNTHFMNPHGLHHPEHRTTAYDLCLIAKRALQFEKFREIVSQPTHIKKSTNLHPEEKLKQHNHLLRPGRFFYPKAIGIKTGYTSQALNTLVAAAEHEGRTLIAVVLGCEKSDDRYNDVKNLFETAFHEQKLRKIFVKAGEKFSRKIEGAASLLNTTLDRELATEYFPSEEPEHPKAEIHWMISSLPIHSNDRIGELRLIDSHGAILSAVPLFAKEEVKGTWSYTLGQWWKRIVSH